MRGGAEVLKESGGLITFYPGPCKVGSYLRVGWGGGGWGGATPLQKTVYVHLWSWGLTLSVRRMQTLWAERKTRLAWRLRKRYQTNKRHRCKDILQSFTLFLTAVQTTVGGWGRRAGGYREYPRRSHLSFRTKGTGRMRILWTFEKLTIP